MVDISVEILSSVVGIRGGNLARYRVKTWWAHKEVPPNVTFIKLPRLPMIQQYLIMTGKDTTVFVETWQEEVDENSPKKQVQVQRGKLNDGDVEDVVHHLPSRCRFIGMTTYCVDEQLKNPNLNPAVKWLEVRDPIEDVVRGKLLLKVDAKFALSNSTNDKNVDFEEPKVAFSPRRTLAPSYLGEDFSPTKRSVTSMVSSHSRRSDTSQFSLGSALSSIRSQEIGIQTELSLPVLPDISKYTMSLQKAQSMSSSGEQANSDSSSVKYQKRMKQYTKSFPGTSAVMDPLQYAEEILLKHTSASTNRRGQGQEHHPPVLSKPPIPSAAGALRKSSLIRQESVGSIDSENAVEERRYSQGQNLDMGNVEDVIDILNDQRVDPRFSQPTMASLSKGGRLQSQDSQGSSETRKSSLKSVPHPFIAGGGHYYPEPDAMHIRQAPEGSCALHKGPSGSGVQDRVSLNSQRRPDMERDVLSNHNDRGLSSHRFKAVHFDGARAQQHATNTLATQCTSAGSASGSGPQPPVPRRRIAAAIFND